MKKILGLLLLIIILAGGVLAATYIKADPGYVMIAWKSWVLESSVWVAFVLMFAVIGVILLVLLITAFIWQGQKRFSLWAGGRSDKKGRNQLLQGLEAYLSGDWQKAAKLLKKSSNNLDTEKALMPRLLAARAYSASNQTEEALNILRVSSITHEKSLAVGITQAELQYESHQYDACLSTLRRLQQDNPRNSLVLRALVRVCRQLNEWQSLWDMLGVLHKEKVLQGESLLDLEEDICRHLFTKVMEGKVQEQTSVVQALSQVWIGLPKKSRQQPKLVALYAEALHQAGAEDEAEKVVKTALKKHWDEALLHLYGRIHSSHIEKQLKNAEGWLKNNENNSVLLLTLGRLAMANELWGKARDYFESSLAAENRVETYTELGRLLNRLGDSGQGNQYLQKALQSVAKE